MKCIRLFLFWGLVAGFSFESYAQELWTQRHWRPTENWLTAVAWTGAQLVAVGDSGTILTSPDGITWTNRSSGTDQGLSSITWTGTQLVAVGGLGTILTSPD